MKEKKKPNERNKNKNLWIVKFMCDLKQFIIEPHMEKPFHIWNIKNYIDIFSIFCVNSVQVIQCSLVAGKFQGNES